MRFEPGSSYTAARHVTARPLRHCREYCVVNQCEGSTQSCLSRLCVCRLFCHVKDDCSEMKTRKHYCESDSYLFIIEFLLPLQFYCTGISQALKPHMGPGQFPLIPSTYPPSALSFSIFYFFLFFRLTSKLWKST